MCLTICKIQEYSTVNRKGSFKRRKHCFRSPLLSRETCGASAFPEQLVVGEGKAADFPCWSCASLPVRHKPACRSPMPALLLLTSHRWDVGRWGRWRCLLPSVMLVNGDLGWQFTMRLCCLFSCVWLFVTLWTVAYQTLLSIEFPRQGYWSGLPCPSLGDLPNPGTEPVSLMSLALADMFFTTSTTWQAQPWGWCGTNIGDEKGMSLD